MSNTKKIKLTDQYWNSIKYDLADILLNQSFSHEKLNKPVDEYDTIYHYSDLGSLIGILESQNLYSTNINYLNDAKELKHGVSLISEVIDLFRNTKNERIFSFMKSSLNKIYDIDKYVTCFSKNGDLLSQWRSYGNDGKGVAIGFDPLEIEESIYDSIVCMNIMYSESRQKEILEVYIRIIIGYFESIKENIDWTDFDYDNLIADTLIYFLEGIISNFKHPSFSEEKEFRIEYKVDGNINKAHKKNQYFKSSGSLVVPYIKLESRLKKSKQQALKNPDFLKHTKSDINFPVKEIILGPSLDYEMNKISIEKLLSKTGYENVQIKQSTIPYRI
jgi:hypothetical protein